MNAFHAEILNSLEFRSCKTSNAEKIEFKFSSNLVIFTPRIIDHCWKSKSRFNNWMNYTLSNQYVHQHFLLLFRYVSTTKALHRNPHPIFIFRINTLSECRVQLVCITIEIGLNKNLDIRTCERTKNALNLWTHKSLDMHAFYRTNILNARKSGKLTKFWTWTHDSLDIHVFQRRIHAQISMNVRKSSLMHESLVNTRKSGHTHFWTREDRTKCFERTQSST